MGWQNKESKQGSNNKNIDKKLINDKLKNNIGNIKSSVEKAGSAFENKTKVINLNKDYILWGIGTAFFLVTAIWSITFAINISTIQLLIELMRL